MTPARYAVRLPGGGWAYHLTRATCGDLPDGIHYGDPRWSVNGEPLTPAKRSGWFLHPDRLAEVTASFGRGSETVGYRLAAPDMESAALPATLTVDEYRARTRIDVDEYNTSALLVSNAYEAVTEPRSPHMVTVDLSDLVELDGSSPVAVPSGATWVPSLPSALSQYPEYTHLFPGHLEGFWNALEINLKGIKGLEKVYNFERHSPPEFTVYVVARYDPAPTAPETVQHGRRKLRVVQREVLHKEHYKISPPRWIGGRNLAEAAERWEAELARWVGDFREIAAERPCGHCRGTGLAIGEMPR